MSLESFGDFLTKVSEFQSKLSKLPESLACELEARKRFKIVLVGGVGVGKGKLLKRLAVEDKVTVEYTAEGYIERFILQSKRQHKTEQRQCKQKGTLEFVKLPGLTSMARPDQPEDYPQLTSDLFDTQTHSADLVILCEPADRDIVNSDALKRVKDADMDEKVILVVSKVDLLETRQLDEGVLREVAEPFAAIVAVRNAAALESNDSIETTNQKERVFFEQTPIVISWGIQGLKAQILRVLNDQLEREKSAIFASLWRLRVKLEEQLNRYSDPNFNAKLVTEYIDTLTYEISNESVNGSCAMRIGMIFWKCLPEALGSIDPLNGIDFCNLSILIKNSQGLRASFQLENAFKVLVRSQLKLSETVIFDCLQLVYNELKRVLIIPVDLEEADDEEFYDVKSISDSEDEDEDEMERVIIHDEHDGHYEDIFDTMPSKLLMVHSQLKLIPGLISSLNIRITELLSTLYARTREYLREYCEMEGEMVYCDDAEFIEAVEDYYKGRSISIGSIESIGSLNRIESLSSIGINHNASSDDVPIQAIKDTSSADNSSSFLKEFLALLFPPPLIQRVEYRPKQQQHFKSAKMDSIKVDTVHSTMNTDTITGNTQSEECEFLLKLLKIYLKAHHRRLASFLPKSLNYHLISKLLKSLACLIYELGEGDTLDPRMSTGGPNTQRFSPFTPPLRGSFPLDRSHICNPLVFDYLNCLRTYNTKKVTSNDSPDTSIANNSGSEACRPLAKLYLECRMQAGLMTEEDLDSLGFK